MDPRVTLIISTYNRCAILRETLDAVAGLRNDIPHNVVVVDDGSSDGTPELLSSWADASPLHRVIERANSGAIMARNNGAHAATTELLIFMDDDIRPAPGFVRAHLAALEAHPDCWVTGPVPDRVPADTSAWGRYRARAVQRWEAALPEGPARDAGWMTAANVSVRREEFLDLGGFDGTLAMGGEDLDLMLRAREDGIHLWFDPAVAAEHHDSFLTLASFCRRQERYNEAVVSVWERHGTSSGLDHRIEQPPRSRRRWTGRGIRSAHPRAGRFAGGISTGAWCGGAGPGGRPLRPGTVSALRCCSGWCDSSWHPPRAQRTRAQRE